MKNDARKILTKMKALAESDLFFQGVSCHKVFMEPHATRNEQFEELIDLLRRKRKKKPNLHGLRGLRGLRGLYSKLLNSGFFDEYLGIHFDVNSVTSYVTVVSGWKWVFDMEMGRLGGIGARHAFAKTQLERLYRVLFLRFTIADTLDKSEEVARYFCFPSILQEIVTYLELQVPLQRHH